MNTMKLDLSNVMVLTINRSAWGNRKMAEKKKIQSSADKKMLSVSKKLIDSQEFLEIQRLYRDIDTWINFRSVPSFYLEGQRILRKEYVAETVEYLNQQVKELEARVENLINVFEVQKQEAKILLDTQYRESDYPTPNELRRKFSIRWNWLQFEVPQGLPENIFKEEKMKAEARWAESTELIASSLREAFLKLIDHAKESLKVKKGGKVIGFKNASFDNISSFIEAFNNRNIINDRELERLVGKAKEVLLNVDNPQDLKTDSKLRKEVTKNFEEITSTLETMIEVKPTRKFNFEE